MTDLAQLGLSVDSQGFVKAEANMKSFNKTASNTEKQASKISSQFDGLRRMAGLLTAALSLRAIQHYGDQWTDLNSRILNATKSQRDAVQVMDAISQTARRTYSSLQQTADAFLQNNLVMKELGYTTKQQIDFSDALNNSLVISGTKGQNAAVVMGAIVRAMAEGRLQGREFNLLMTYSSRTVEALAESLGVNTIKLREMVMAGEITGEKIFQLTTQMEKLRAEADAMPATIGDGFLLINNALQQFVGRMNDATGASSYLADFLVDIADAIDTISAALASGQGDLYIRAWVSQWEQATIDILAALDVIKEASSEASFDVGFSWKQALLDIPANLIAAARFMGLGWAHIIAYANLAAKTIGDAFIAQFTVVRNVAELTGRAIIASLNPLDKGPSAAEWAAALTDPFKTVVDQFKAQSAILDAAWDDTRDGIFKARDDAITASNDMRKKGDELRDAWEKNRGVFEDVATGVNALGAASDLTYDQIMSLNAGIDKLLGGDLFAFSDAIKEIEIAVQSMTMADAFSAIADGVGQMKNAMQDGSKEAKALGIVLQGLAVAQGVLAVLNQGQGDPYTAFARMAAMAAAVASFGVQVGNMSGGGADSTASNRQAAQGTGTVFGDTSAKSESILRASELTASATSELVGISKGMLSALERMQGGIDSTVAGIIRGGATSSASGGTTRDLADFMGELPKTLFSDMVIKAARDFWRVKTKIVDSGIEVLGGALGEILSGTVDFAGIYAEIEKKKKLFGITVSKNKDLLSEAVGDEVGSALLMVMTSMADAVSSAAEVLGISVTDIEQRINQYEIAAQKISLKDLSSQEQQEQLSAVFSSIFDGLAAEVVPFVKEFSQLGEGYAETLIRIATQVQVATEASKQLGFAIESGLSPQQMAQFADALVDAGGGIEQFISKMQAFVGAFATDEHKFTVASDAINSALSQMGLEVPASREALFALMGTLTDPAQINGLLDLTGAFGEYFDQLDKGQQAVEAANRAALESLTSLSDSALAALRKSVDSEKDRLTAEYGLAVDAVNAQFDAKIAKAEEDYAARANNLARVLDRTRESMASLLSLSEALRAASHANVIETDQLNRARRESAQGVITGALATGNLSGVEAALKTLSMPSESLFGTFEEFAIDAALTANHLANLADRTETQADAQERTVMRLEAMSVSAAEQHKQLLATLDIQRSEQLAAMELGYNAQIASLDQIVIDAEEMLNYLRNIDTTEYSILESLDRFSDAVINEANQRQAMSNDEMNESLSTISAEITVMKNQLTDLASKTLKELEIQTNEMMQEAS